MKKKIRIIDLLNKIYSMKEREKLPYELKYKGNIYKWCNDIGDYRKDGHSECLIMKEIFTFDQFTHNSLYNMLYDEVEIIEEDKKIEKLEHWVDVESWVKGNDLEKGLEEQSEFNKNIYYKINDIIDTINELRRGE